MEVEMNDKMTELVVKISTELAILNTQTKQVLDTLSAHERRILELEKSKSSSLKDDVIAIAVKGLVVGIIALGSVSGAGALIGKLLVK